MEQSKKLPSLLSPSRFKYSLDRYRELLEDNVVRRLFDVIEPIVLTKAAENDNKDVYYAFLKLCILESGLVNFLPWYENDTSTTEMVFRLLYELQRGFRSNTVYLNKVVIEGMSENKEDYTYWCTTYCKEADASNFLKIVKDYKEVTGKYENKTFVVHHYYKTLDLETFISMLKEADVDSNWTVIEGNDYAEGFKDFDTSCYEKCMTDAKELSYQA